MELHPEIKFVSNYSIRWIHEGHHLESKKKKKKHQSQTLYIFSTISHFNFTSHFMLSLIPSHFFYWCYCWNCTTGTEKKKLQRNGISLSFFYFYKIYLKIIFSGWWINFMIWAKMKERKKEIREKSARNVEGLREQETNSNEEMIEMCFFLPLLL